MQALLRLTGAAGAPGVQPLATPAPHESASDRAISCGPSYSGNKAHLGLTGGDVGNNGKRVSGTGSGGGSKRVSCAGSGGGSRATSSRPSFTDRPPLPSGWRYSNSGSGAGAGPVLSEFDITAAAASSAVVVPALGVPERFVAAGGMYALFLLLHHEVCGMHHSKLVSSLVSLLNFVLGSGAASQVGGPCKLVACRRSLFVAYAPQGVRRTLLHALSTVIYNYYIAC